MEPFASTPWPMILTPQCSQVGASAWIAHSKLSNTCGWSSGRVTRNALSYSLPHTSHLAISLAPLRWSPTSANRKTKYISDHPRSKYHDPNSSGPLPALSGRELREEPEARRTGKGDLGRKRRDPRPAGARLALASRGRHSPDIRHQTPQVSRRERSGGGDNPHRRGSCTYPRGRAGGRRRRRPLRGREHRQPLA